MPYSEHNQQRTHGGGRSRGSNGRSGSDRQRSGRGTRSRQHDHQGPDPLRGNRYKSDHNYKSLSGHDTGYNLRRGGMGRGHRSAFPRRGIDRRTAVLIGGAIAILVILFIVISSCTRSCSSQRTQDEQREQREVNSYDSRVASGVSEALTNKFTPTLDKNEKLAWIAENANLYSDEHLPELALRESAAIDFVASVPSHDKTETSYGEGVEKNSYPQLYDWDTRWGYVEYGGSNVGVNGSALTSLAMAYMGLTGKTDHSISDLAKLAQEGNYVTSDGGTSEGFFTGVAESIGLVAREYTPSGDNITLALGEGEPVIVRLNAGFTTPYAHWAVVVSQNSDGSVTMYDPDSTSASTHTWAPGTIAGKTSKMFAMSAASGGSSGSSSNVNGASGSSSNGSSSSTTS
ncbi:MAG: hypothetical protein J6D54_08060 [Olsenella sp.]|nr:hypothetical protein [Olsenella sp.]